ncbi:MAG: methyltransferase domain-containing protein [Xanthomonadales bacterium]|nr:class I SAM-dependent methyltransferase [Xanthomonadales bacterium]NIQ93780.1 class I SAM-dependent methyltransferase [Desulfuromonadales bacterium]NIX13443.1 methyltransferase domain-containing protein [Xanthomonadales bacterium]
MRREAKFWHKRAERYAQRPVADQASYEKKLEITRGYLRPDSEVLEIGCGTGSTALALAPCAGHVLATDIAPGMIEIAKRKAAAAGIRNVTFETRAADEHGIPESRYDVIMAHNLLHLLEDPEAVIVAACRGLRPGGAFVTSTACIGDMSWYFRILAPVGPALGLFPPVKVVSREWLRKKHLDAGFAIDHEWVPKKNAAVFMVAIRQGA